MALKLCQGRRKPASMETLQLCTDVLQRGLVFCLVSYRALFELKAKIINAFFWLDREKCNDE